MLSSNSINVAQVEHWFCSTCTYENLPMVSECAMCNTQSPLFRAQREHEKQHKRHLAEQEEMIRINTAKKLAMIAELEADFDNSSDSGIEHSDDPHPGLALDAPPMMHISPRYHNAGSDCYMQHLPLDISLLALSYITIDSKSLSSLRCCSKHFLPIAENRENWKSQDYELENITTVVGTRHVVGTLRSNKQKDYTIGVTCSTILSSVVSSSTLNNDDTAHPNSKKLRLNNGIADNTDSSSSLSGDIACSTETVYYIDWYFVTRQHSIYQHVESQWMFLVEGWRWIKASFDELLWHCMQNTPHHFTGHRSSDGAVNSSSDMSPADINFQQRANFAKKEHSVTLIQCGSLPAAPEECFSYEKRVQFQRTCQKLLVGNWQLLRSSLLVLISLVAEGLARRIEALATESEKTVGKGKEGEKGVDDIIALKLKLGFEVRWCWSVFQLWMEGVEGLMQPLGEQISSQRDSDFANRKLPMPYLEDSAVSIFRHSFLLRPPILLLLTDLLEHLKGPEPIICGNSIHSFVNEELGSDDKVLAFVMEDARNANHGSLTHQVSAHGMLVPSSIRNNPAFVALEALLVMLEKIDETPDAENSRLVLGKKSAGRSVGVALPPPPTQNNMGNGGRGLLRRKLLVPLLIHMRRGHWRRTDDSDTDLLLAGFQNNSKSAQRRRTFTQRNHR